jgi:hypothetical protein
MIEDHAKQSVRRLSALQTGLEKYRNDSSGPREKISKVFNSQVRRFCLECCGGDAKAVLYCTCDGVHSTSCEWWKFRFGKSPETISRRYGPRMVTPEMMPGADVELDDLPFGIEAASTCDFQSKP